MGRRFLALVEEVGQRFDREMVSGRVCRLFRMSRS